MAAVKGGPPALAHLDAHINEAFADNAIHYSAFSDLENAFPRVWRHHILNSLHQYGLRGALSTFIYVRLTLLRLSDPKACTGGEVPRAFI